MSARAWGGKACIPSASIWRLKCLGWESNRWHW